MPPKRRHLKELAADPRFIPGVHNYCDRWCERCPLTSRCMVYAMEQQDAPDDPAARDVRNQAFWERMAAILHEAHEMLEELMSQHGIAPEPPDPQAGQRLVRQHAEIRGHPLSRAGTAYTAAVEEWFGRAEVRFRERGEALERQDRMGLPGADPEAEALRLREAVEVVRWYQHQIVVKIMRALGSTERDAALDLPLDSGDADGSAKVALIGIDHSLAAWSELLRQLPEEEDGLLPLLAALSRLRRDVEAAFPGARAFVRPGFDTDEAPAPE